MRKNRFIVLGVLGLLCNFSAKAELWTTYFAYNNVTQIAMAPDKVYAISDGSLFSVEKQTEKITKYDRQSGLHGTGINYIHYDTSGNQLIIAYGDGKIDILSESGVIYISELYNKDMTQRKNIYNITIQGRTAYLSTHYGVQTMDLRENKLVDSYWLRPGGEETPIGDVLIANDSIYAFGGNYDKKNEAVKFDSLFCASLHDNIVDYTFWKREKNTGRIARDTDKGVHYQDAQSNWYAGGADGIKRITATDTLTYKPDGPLVNNIYRMKAAGNRLGIVQGAYAVSFSKRPGLIMILNDKTWQNYDETYMTTHLGMKSTDYSDIIFDPTDQTHFYVTSFGYGLIEFRQDTFYAHYNADNSAIESISSTQYPYLWVDGLRYDTDGNLWMLNVCNNGVKILQPNGNWISLSNNACKNLDRAKDLLISVTNPNIKFISTIRVGIGAFDDNGTLEDQSDDRAVIYTDFQDENGNTITLPRVSSFFQTPSGVLLVGTEAGLYSIDNPETMLDGNNTCVTVNLSLPSEERLDIFGPENIRSITTDNASRIWIGTQYSGLYCISADLNQVLEHFSIENSPLPSNDILSLCWMKANNHLFIGTSNGLVEFDLEHKEEGLTDIENEEQNIIDQGDMMQWRLHFSYANPQEIVATNNQIYAAANGALFSVDRADESIVYWNKSTGLTGTTVAHIAYDAGTERLIITYENGQIDLLNAKGDVIQMPDLSMKAGSIAVTINNICVGSKYTYLAMPFGIIAINTRKGEVSETYYIGDNAASVNVQQVVEYNDSLFAFSFDRVYKAALKDNLVDFSFWKSDTLPFGQIQRAVIHNNQCFVLAHDSLYRREGTNWDLVVNSPISWIHESGNQLLVYQPTKGLFRLLDDYQLRGLSNTYVATDAIYSNGEYWLAEEGKGLVRLGSEGDDFFRPEGPMNNFGYRLQVAHNQIYVSPGGRWATMYGRQSDLSIYDGKQWIGIPWPDTWYYTDHNIRDVVSYAVDNNDPSHFFTATYGTGVFEFKDYKAINHYDSINSTLRRLAPAVNDYYYTCTDGAMMDEFNNMWVMNATSIGYPLNIRTSAGQWYGLPLISGGNNIKLTTPSGIWIDRSNSHYKWMMDQRANQCIILLDDKGTPTDASDDHCMARNSFTDQNGNTLTPSQFRCFAQDHSNRIWIGTDKGIILIPKEVDFFTSNACRRIIIPRNDGTGLGDYLLGDEQINCLAVDGGNRMWIGTANSGLYLIEDDTITVAHFTEHNSLLPSNNIHSIAIMPKTGEVFVGTDNGIASYRSDASEAQENMSGAYAYPNPVRPNYGGVISITGLMENTVVNIVDASGNLVCKTKSHGGTAVWDGKLPDGQRAIPGVYTALCNAVGGHTVVKIMVMR